MDAVEPGCEPDEAGRKDRLIGGTDEVVESID